MKSTTEKPRPFGDIREPEEERQPKSFRLLRSLSERLAAAAQKFECSENYYIELALRNQFERDGFNDQDEPPKRKEPKKSP